MTSLLAEPIWKLASTGRNNETGNTVLAAQHTEDCSKYEMMPIANQLSGIVEEYDVKIAHSNKF
jgi:hypothetical protein